MYSVNLPIIAHVLVHSRYSSHTVAVYYEIALHMVKGVLILSIAVIIAQFHRVSREQ